LEDVNEDNYESKPRKDSGNIFCKATVLLCLGIFVIGGLITFYNFLIVLTHLPPPRLDTFAIVMFILGFIIGWIVREITKN
jgi:ABC-type antimicrobial peptide transport system permease subunit